MSESLSQDEIRIKCDKCLLQFTAGFEEFLESLKPHLGPSKSIVERQLREEFGQTLEEIRREFDLIATDPFEFDEAKSRSRFIKIITRFYNQIRLITDSGSHADMALKNLNSDNSPKH